MVFTSRSFVGSSSSSTFAPSFSMRGQVHPVPFAADSTPTLFLLRPCRMKFEPRDVGRASFTTPACRVWTCILAVGDHLPDGLVSVSRWSRLWST